MKIPSGIYIIVCTSNDRVYVGSAINLLSRMNRHKYLLEKGEHKNTVLQRAWNKYGPSSFKFLVMEHCNKEVLIEKEQMYIDGFSSHVSKLGFNLSPTAGNCLGVKQPEEAVKKRNAKLVGRKTSEETKQKQRTLKLGIKQSPDHVIKRISKRCVLSEKNLIDMFNMAYEGVNFNSLSKVFPLCRGAISNILKGNNKTYNYIINSNKELLEAKNRYLNV